MHHFWIIRLQGGQEEQADAGPTQRVEPLVGSGWFGPKRIWMPQWTLGVP